MSHLTLENRKLISSMITQGKKCIEMSLSLLGGRLHLASKDAYGTFWHCDFLFIVRKHFDGFY